MTIRFTLNGSAVEVEPRGSRQSLLDALRGDAAVTSAKDGCAPQGQCGCCTVLVDGSARVACVTPLRRVAGREVTTIEGLDDGLADGWADRFVDRGASQCGFCTPGIIMRLEDRRRRRETPAPGHPAPSSHELAIEVDRALAAHLCRCTGWQGISEAACEVLSEPGGLRASGPPIATDGDGSEAASARATLEAGGSQRVDRAAILGRGGFAADTPPLEALVAMCAENGEWVVGETIAEARELSDRVQGRRTTLDPTPPLAVPDGDWMVTLRTSWVEPGYLETDASWCEPGGEPATPLANSGAFGGKLHSPLPEVARRLADRHGRAVLALWSREDVVRKGPKRPPVAAGMRSDGTGRMDMAADAQTCTELRDAIVSAAPGLEVRPVEVAGPPSSADLRAAGWAEAFCLMTAAGVESPIGGVEADAVTVTLPTGASATVRIHPAGTNPDGKPALISVDVDAGDTLDEAVLRSYVIGAVHMAAGWVTSEGLAVDREGEVHDLTIRSFGILPAGALPEIELRSHGSGTAVAVGDAVFVATAAAIWRHHDHRPDWPLGSAVL